MALPIGVTPILTGKAAAEFLTKMHKDAQRPVGLTPTPKLEEARKLIKKYAEHQQKRVP